MHFESHFSAHPGVAFEVILRPIQQSEYDSLEVEAQRRKETLAVRHAEVLQERNEQVAQLLQQLQEIDRRYARVLNDLIFEMTSIDGKLVLSSRSASAARSGRHTMPSGTVLGDVLSGGIDGLAPLSVRID